MKVHFLVNDDTFSDDYIDKNKISKIAEKVFKIKVDDFKIYHMKNMVYGKSPLDYNCVIDEKLDGDVLAKKRTFTEELQKYLSNVYGRQLNAIVKIESNFQIESIAGNRRNVSNTSKGTEETESEFDYEKRAAMYVPVNPSYTFDRVILPQKVREKIEESLAIVQCERKVFQEWGLSVIQPNPSSALSFYGPSGTGKTMAAEAIADKLNKKILKVSYADIESKYHGEGPKMVKAIFCAAQKEDAVLFIDESDSLLSKRLTNVTQGSEQAINSMRSQLLICLEEYKGIVIFATNLVVNYDQAFLTRLISVEFIKPDAECREKIWNVHISGNGINIPLADDVDTKELAEKYEFCGRDIRKTVISACVSVAMQDKDIVTQADFIQACEKVKDEEIRLSKAEDHTTSSRKPSPEQQDLLKEAIKNKIAEENNKIE